MPVTHEPWLVALSLFLAIQGSFVGLSLAVQVGDAVGLRRRLLIAAAAVSLAFAIWTMHFIGMLAARLPFPVDYLVLPTLLSFLICVIVVGAAVFAANAGPLTPTRLAAAAVFMGLGIVSMHYTGMTALHASAHMTHAAGLRRRQRRGGDRGLRARALARQHQPWPAAAAVLGERARHRDRRHALHRDGGRDDLPARGAGLRRAGAVDGSAGDRGRDRRVPGVRHLPARPGAGSCGRATGGGARRRPPRAACGRKPAATARSRRNPPAIRFMPATAPTRARAATRRSAAPAPRRGARRAICRSSGTAPPTTSRSTTSSRSTPTRTTPTSSTGATSCFARSPSARSNPGSTPPASPACTAATSSISTGSWP